MELLEHRTLFFQNIWFTAFLEIMGSCVTKFSYDLSATEKNSHRIPYSKQFPRPVIFISVRETTQDLADTYKFFSNHPGRVMDQSLEIHKSKKLL